MPAEAASRPTSWWSACSTDEQAREVCLGSELLTALPEASAVVVHTTVSPTTMDAVAARAEGVDVIDAPVSGGPHDVSAGRLTLFVGGTAKRCASGPVLRCYGDPVLHVGRTVPARRSSW